MRILFNNRKYDSIAGGVERMSVALMNEMVRRGHQIALTSLDPPTAHTFYPLDASIEWTRIDIGEPNRRATPREIIARQIAMRRAITRFRPDVIIGFQQGAFIAAAVAALGTGIPVIAAERNAPHRFDHLKDGHGRTFQYQSFRLARVVTVQLESYRAHYPPHVRRRIVSIPNPVPPSEVIADPAGGAGAQKILLCVARLSYQKNQGLLIEAFGGLAERFADWDLVLVGEGEDRAAIEALAATVAPPGRIHLAGAQDDVSQYYRAAQLFCLPSRWEGFPNALAEAMASGLPAVGLAACAGVNTLIAQEKTGLLAPESDADTLARTLGTLMADPERRVTMGSAARKAIADYSPRAIFDQWEALFERAARQ